MTRCVHAKAAAFAHCKKVDQNHGQIEPVCAIACISNHRISRPSTAVQRVCMYVACELLYMCELSVHSSSERACTSVASCLERHALRRNNVNCHASNQYCKQLLLFGRFAGVWESCAKCYSSKLTDNIHDTTTSRFDTPGRRRAPRGQLAKGGGQSLVTRSPGRDHAAEAKDSPG